VPRPQGGISNAIHNSVLSANGFRQSCCYLPTLGLPLYRAKSAPTQFPWAAPLSDPDPALDFEEVLITANDALIPA
jgi:hypothetical protein